MMQKYFALPILGISLATLCDSVFETIAKENMKTMPHTLHDETHACMDLPYSEQLEKAFNRQSNPSRYELRQTLFHMFALQPLQQPTANILDKHSWQDLNLLCGPYSDATAYLAAKIDRTHTELGKIMLLYTITHPEVDIQRLENKQLLVKELLANTSLYKELDILFKGLHDAERILPSLYQHDTFKDVAQQHAIRIPLFPSLTHQLNTTNCIVEVNERIHELRNIIITALNIGGLIVLPATAVALLARKKKIADDLYFFGKDTLKLTDSAAFFSFMGLATWLLTWFSQHRFLQAASHIANGFNYGVWAYDAFDYAKTDFMLLYYVQMKLMHSARLVEAMYMLDNLVAEHTTLRERWPSAHTFRRFLYEESAANANLKHLLELLSSPTFQETASLFSRAGTILVAFRLLTLVQATFIEPLMALGELDVVLSTVALYKEGEGSSARWTFPTYQTAQKPSIHLQGFWNPFIHPQRVVLNDASLGTDNPPAMIITGPNAGGKSTIGVKGITLTLLLAQSLGIAPAQELIFTPFAKIMTHLNITDDIAAGHSHFKAGVLRARDIITTINNCKDYEFCFVALDELFNGTTHDEGQAAAYSFIEEIGQRPHVLLTTATHFPLVTKLEQKYSTLFKNYKVSVAYDDHHNLVYPFKLEPGIADQKIALDVLRQEGFSDEFLQKARELIKA